MTHTKLYPCVFSTRCTIDGRSLAPQLCFQRRTQTVFFVVPAHNLPTVNGRSLSRESRFPRRTQNCSLVFFRALRLTVPVLHMIVFKELRQRFPGCPARATTVNGLSFAIYCIVRRYTNCFLEFPALVVWSTSAVLHRMELSATHTKLYPCGSRTRSTVTSQPCTGIVDSATHNKLFLGCAAHLPRLTVAALHRNCDSSNAHKTVSCVSRTRSTVNSRSLAPEL